MADTKLTGLGALTSSTGDDLIYIVDDPAGSPTSYKITKNNFFKFTDGAVIYDSNGNEILKVVATASAVNEVTFQNGATGNPAKIYTTGDNTNIGLLLTGKGTGKIIVGDSADSTKQITFELVGATTGKVLTFTSNHTLDRTITLPDATTTLVGTDTSQTLTNKTLTSPVISSISNTGTLTLPTSTDTLVGKATTDTLTNKTLTAPKIADSGFIADANGNEYLIFGQTTSAVNEVKITNNSTGAMPKVSASGETNIGLELNPKGTGKITITDGTDTTKKVNFNVSGVTTATTRTLTLPDYDATIATLAGTETLSAKTLTAPKIANAGYIADANGNEEIIFTTTASAVNEITLANSATGGSPSITASGGDSNVSLQLSPKGTGVVFGNLETFAIAISDETTAITTGTAKVTFRMPYAFKVVKVKASLTTASTSGLPTFDINEAGTSILGANKLSIDANELTSETAVTATSISDSALADDAQITIDVDTAGTGATGAKIYIIGYATAKPA